MPKSQELLSTAVPALDQAMAVLSYLEQHGSADSAALQQVLMLPEVSLSRLLSSLVSHGLLRRQQNSYALGLKLFRLGCRARAVYDLPRIAEPFLQQLHDKSGLTCNLALIDGLQARCAVKIESQPCVVTVRSSAGGILPVHSTALGKVLLAFSPPELTRRILNLQQPFARYTENTQTNPEALQEELQQVRALGFAADAGEDSAGVICYAVPVLNADGLAEAAVSVSGSSVQFNAMPFLQILDLLQQCARGITATLI